MCKKGGNGKATLKSGGGLLMVAVLVSCVCTVIPVVASAADGETIEERREQREAEREARRVEREERREQREAEREARRVEREAEQEANNCSCTTSINFSRPDVRFQGNSLIFVPRVDVAVRTRGESSGPDWSVNLNYEGMTSFASEDVVAPDDMTFSGSKEVVSGSCGDNRYNFRGLALAPVNFSTVVRTLLGHDEELDGTIRMKVRVEGCGVDEEKRMSTFSVGELGNLHIHGWHSWR